MTLKQVSSYATNASKYLIWQKYNVFSTALKLDTVFHIKTCVPEEKLIVMMCPFLNLEISEICTENISIILQVLGLSPLPKWHRAASV